MSISADSEQYIFTYCKTKNKCKALISRAGFPFEINLLRDCECSLKRLLSCMKRQSQRSDGIPLRSVRESSLILARNDVKIALSGYFCKLFSTDDGEKTKD